LSEAELSTLSSVEVWECVELYLRSLNTTPWRCAHLKHRGNFTIIFYPSHRRLGGPQSWTGSGNEENIRAPNGNRNSVVQPVAQSLRQGIQASLRRKWHVSNFQADSWK